MDNLSDFIYKYKNIFLKVIWEFCEILNPNLPKNTKKPLTKDSCGELPFIPEISCYDIGASLSESQRKKSAYFIDYVFKHRHFILSFYFRF